MRIAIFGANGPTGHQLMTQAAAAGHQLVAVTRNPHSIRPLDHVTVVAADATHPEEVNAAVAGSDAVLSVLGVSYSRRPITVYSVGTANIIDAMQRHDVSRLIVVSSAPLDPAYRPSDSFFFTRVMQPLFMSRPGRTTYDDMRRMESRVRDSDRDWTIVRSSWLFNCADVTDYQLTTNGARGMFTARADLAAALLTQVADDRFIGRTVAVVTTDGTPSIVRQIWREGIRKERKA
jgi:putative NADH-flavin reductase